MESTPEHSEQQDQIEFVEPIQLFSSLKMIIGEDKFNNDVTVSELVHKDQQLFEFTNTDQFKVGEVERQPIEIGANCYISDDKNAVFSATMGYPKISFNLSPELETKILHVSVEPLFRITTDRMKASIAIHPPLPNCQSLVDENLEKLLDKEGIVSGIIPENLKSAQEYIKLGLKEFNVLILAIGKKPVHGTDAYLKFEVETGPIPGKLLKDGSIDFRERKIFVPVSNGEVIATKIPATTGTSGKTVLGERVDPEPGRDIAVNTLKDAAYSIKSRKVTATADGVLSVVGDTIIKVCSRQEIMSDIDYNTGHIESRNSVLIHGSVHPGFKVKTDGDLEIRGAIMSTRIESNANVVIKSGITGKNSSVTADGDVDIYFVEQGKIYSGSNCIIRKQSYYSNIIAGANIRCTPKSVVVGGQVIAAGNLTLGNVGSTNASPALICAGVDGKRLELYNSLKKKLIEQQEGLIQWLQMNKGTAKARKIRNMERAVEETRLQLVRMNMIPRTGIYSRAGDDVDDHRLKGKDYSDEGGINIAEVYIEIFGIIYAGTQLRIGNRTMTLEHTIANRLFKLNNPLTEIAAFPLRRR